MGLPWDGPAGPSFTWGEGFSANAPSCVWHILLAPSRGGPGHPPYSNFGVWEGPVPHTRASVVGPGLAPKVVPGLRGQREELQVVGAALTTRG